MVGAAPFLPPIEAGDLKTISAPVDFFGVNIYHGDCWRAGTHGEPETVAWEPGHPSTAFRWFVTPEVLYWEPKFFQERYRLPIYITENGLDNVDWMAAFMTHSGLTSLPAICGSWAWRSGMAWTCAGISTGRSWTISNGPRAISNASA